MRALLVIFSLTLLFTGGCATAPARSLAPSAILPIQEQIIGKATGVVLVARQGEVLWVGTFSNPAYSEIPSPTRDTAFDLASMSKTFTAVAVLRLAERGQVDLDAPLRRYLPELPASTADITLRHALAHDTGWPQYLSGDDQTMKTAEEVLLEIAAIQREREAGSGYRYSDVGFVASALVVERVTGQDFRDAMTQLVFTPASLRSTGFYGAKEHASQTVASGFVSGAATGSPQTLQYTWNLAGTGQVVATADDLLRFNRALVEGGLLGPEARDLLFSAGVDTGGRKPFRSADILSPTYGMGLYHWTDRAGRHVHYHGGANDFGFNSNMLWREDDDVFVAALFNSGSIEETFDRSAFMEAVLASLEGPLAP
jgi:CubicO group peptidase (beta-lactamase class C family)